MNDNDLRDAFRAVAREDAGMASPFSRSVVDARRPFVRAQRRALYTASGFALAAAATLLFVVMPRQELLDLDLSGPTWAPSTDFLLNTPGSSLMRSIPSIGVMTESRTPETAPSSSDTSGR